MKLKISPDLALPSDAVTEKLGFLGRTGSGKTYAAQKLAEEMHAAGAQFVVLDPVGVWYGLRLASDGKAPGLPVPVLGGLRGDIPLEPGGGALIANLVVDRGISVVIDVSQFESDADKARFAQAFAERFFFRKKASPSAVHVFVEECQEFVPQNPQREEGRMLHAFTRMWKLGRNFGIGGSLISQRPQEVNKKVLNLTELLFCFQLTGPQERKTLKGWIAEKGISEDIDAELPKLRTGHPHVWSPAWLQVSQVVPIAEKWTLDASSTPKVGGRAKERALSPIDLEQLRGEMASTLERAKAEDPRELRRQIAELKKELAKKPAAAPPAMKEKRVEIPVLKDTQVKRLEATLERMVGEAERHGKAMGMFWGNLNEVADALLKAMRSVVTPAARAPSRPTLVPRPVPPRPAPAPRRHLEGNGRDVPFGRGELAILTAIAQHGDAGVSREQLTVLTGYRRSTRDTYLQRLSMAVLIAQAGPVFVATEQGREVLGEAFEPLPTGDDLRAHWLQKLPEGERRILEALVGAYPGDVSREAISEATGYARSSRDTYLQRLGARRLVVPVGRGAVRASEILFS